MRSLRRIKRLFWIAVVFLSLMAGSILLMPLATKIGEENRSILLGVGLAFWLSMIAGYFFVYVANRERKWFIRKKLDGDVGMGCRPGVITFFDNVLATVADVVMIASFLLLIGVSFTELKYEYISYVLLSLLIFSLNMHCLLNGRIYKVTKFKRTRRERSYE